MNDLTLPFVYDPAQYPAELANVTHVTLYRSDSAVLRNDEQIQALTASGVAVRDPLPGTDPFREQGYWYYIEEAAQAFRAMRVIFSGASPDASCPARSSPRSPKA